MGKLKSERHHWWPECVSRHWADESGCAHWLRPNGQVIRSTPNNFGIIGNAHHIKLGDDPEAPSPWDESFESAFQTADGNFPKVIAWLDGLQPGAVHLDQPLVSRIVPRGASDEQFSQLIECIVSLAVRSPMHRAAAVRAAEHFRGTIKPRERNALIGLNIRHSLRTALKIIGGRGKAMIVFSPAKEFIFGDGFFNNLVPPVDHLHSPKLFVPITPRIAVLFARPSRFTVEPRLVALVVSDKEADGLNRSVQIYAKDAIFYRAERPEVTEHFAQAQHLEYADHCNPLDELIHLLPGVLSRNNFFDSFLNRSAKDG